MVYAVMSLVVSATKSVLGLWDVSIQLILPPFPMPKSIWGLSNDNSSVCLIKPSTDLLFACSWSRLGANKSCGCFEAVLFWQTLAPKSQHKTVPSLPPENNTRSVLLLQKDGKCTDATDESWPSGNSPVCTKFRFSIAKILILPSPRPAANKFPLGLQFKEYTMGGLHTCGFPASVTGVDIEKEDIGRLVCGT